MLFKFSWAPVLDMMVSAYCLGQTMGTHLNYNFQSVVQSIKTVNRKLDTIQHQFLVLVPALELVNHSDQRVTVNEDRNEVTMDVGRVNLFTQLCGCFARTYHVGRDNWPGDAYPTGQKSELAKEVMAALPPLVMRLPSRSLM